MVLFTEIGLGGAKTKVKGLVSVILLSLVVRAWPSVERDSEEKGKRVFWEI